MVATADSWRSQASLEMIKYRANLLRKIRDFMKQRNVLEVETPVLAKDTVTDPNIDSFDTEFNSPQSCHPVRYYLQSSPEYAMKRLLACNTGPIYQVCKAFRNHELGSMHNPEFTLLEWYQLDYSMHDMMDEVEQLTTELGCLPCGRISYREVFQKHTGLDPHLTSVRELAALAKASGLFLPADNRSTLLEFLFDKFVVSELEGLPPTFVYDYPVCQSALARIRQDNPPVAERFELYISGIEIANGFNELGDAAEIEARFEMDREERKKRSKTIYHSDEKLLAAMSHGLPPCSGVAMGLDRLLMVLFDYKNIEDTMAFSFQVA